MDLQAAWCMSDPTALARSNMLHQPSCVCLHAHLLVLACCCWWDLEHHSHHSRPIAVLQTGCYRPSVRVRCFDESVPGTRPGHVLWANQGLTSPIMIEHCWWHHWQPGPIPGAMETCLSPSATVLCTYWPYDMSYSSCANNGKLQRNWLRTSTLGCQQPANDWRLPTVYHSVCGTVGWE